MRALAFDDILVYHKNISVSQFKKHTKGVVFVDKIIIRGMKVFGYHGTKPEEQANGQDFIIDVEIKLDLKKAAFSDNVEDSIDSCQVYSMVKYIAKNNIFRLIERLADNIAREILSRNDKVVEVMIRIMKPDAPLTGEFDSVGVEYILNRDNL